MRKIRRMPLDIRPAPLSRRRFLYLASLALAAPALGVRSAAAAEESWVQNFKETELWDKPKGGKSVDRAPQWSYFKVLGGQDGARLPVEHPVSKKKVYIEAATVGASGPPDPTWAFGQPKPAQPAAPAPAASAPATLPPPPAPVQGAAAGSWVASLAPAPLWTAPSGGIPLGQADAGAHFKVLEPQNGPRLKVQDPLTDGLAYVEAQSVGPAAAPGAPRVPGRWWGYVGSDNINVRAEPTGESASLGTLARGTPVVVEAWIEGQEVINDQPGWAKLVEGVYVYGPLLRKARIESPPPMPSHGALGNKWMDVNLTHQTVTAYEGSRPVYMAYTSSGRPGWETREGVHEVLWRKENETMDSATLVGRDASRASYRIENIRWTQYFTSDGQAIHENFWRDPALFGIPSSHGCLGMVSQDTLWFWLWASVGTPVSVHP